jgi:hypothetical protein
VRCAWQYRLRVGQPDSRGRHRYPGRPDNALARLQARDVRSEAGTCIWPKGVPLG